MSTIYYNQKWQSAIGDLLDCVEEENAPLEENRNDKGINYKRTDLEWFQYYACLYIRYVQTYKQLEDSHDQMVHPQKRVLIKQMLENVMIRMCEIKQNMVRYSTQSQILQSDYLNIDEILLEMKLTPKALEIPIPRYFLDKTPRDQFLENIISDMGVVPEEETFSEATTLDTNLQTAIRILQKLERGRQGIVRGIEFMKIKNRPHRERSNQVGNQQQVRATAVQKYWRAFLSRQRLAKIRQQELKFLGIIKEPIDVSLLEKAEKQRKLLKMVQNERARKFQKEKDHLRNQIKKTQEHNIKSKMLDQRRKWIQKFLEMHEFSNLPKNSDDFYKNKDQKAPEESKEKKKQKKQDEKKPKKNEIDKFIDQHDAIGPTESVLKAQENIGQYSESWGTRDNTEISQEFYDTEMARDALRPQIQNQLQRLVDGIIDLELDNMRVKYGIKKKKDKKKKKKKKKEKKIKIPQGLSKRNPKDLLEELFEKGIAKVLKPAHMKDFIGEHNSLTYMVEKSSQLMPDPSLSQIRQIAAEYIGIPLGSQIAKEKLQKWNWFMFYGAMGTGKTMIIRALQTQTNSIVFDLTPEFVRDRYQQKSELTKLIWSVIICAKEYQPSIVMIDEFETIFSGVKSKKKDREAPPSFGPKMKKIIVDMKKNKLWTKTDRIAVIGCSNRPYDAALKEVKKLFDKKIYFPYPNYATRKLLIQNFIEARVGKPVTNFALDTFANITEGFTAGSYKSCIEKVLTDLRLQRLNDEPLKLSEFISPLSNTVCVFAEEYEKMRKFTDQATGLKEKRQKKKGGEADNPKERKDKKPVKR